MRPGEMASQVGFGPRAVVWRAEPWYRLWRGVVTDNTYRCRSPALTLNGCELTPSTGTQCSEQEYSYWTASNRYPSTLYSHNITLSFQRWTWLYTFPRSTNHVYKSLAWSQDFVKICWRVKICSAVLRPRQNTLWVSSSFGSIICASSWHTLSLGG